MLTVSIPSVWCDATGHCQIPLIINNHFPYEQGFFSRSSLLKINQTTEQPKRDHRTRKQRLIIDGRAAGESKTFFYVPVQVHLVRRLVVPLLPGHRQVRRPSWSSSPSAPSIGGRDALKASSSVSFWVSLSKPRKDESESSWALLEIFRKKK